MSYLYQNPLILVVIVTVLLSPFVLKLASNQNLACALTADGAQELKQSLGHQVVTIFVMPPSPQELEKRLQHRNTKDLQIRLQNAALEMEQQDAFDYKIVNDDLAQSTQELIKIFSQETK